jgi:hypothetical protein
MASIDGWSNCRRAFYHSVSIWYDPILLPNVLMQTKPRAFICLHFCWDCLVSPSRMILFHGMCTVSLKSGLGVIALMILNRFHKKVPTWETYNKRASCCCSGIWWSCRECFWGAS